MGELILGCGMGELILDILEVAPFNPNPVGDSLPLPWFNSLVFAHETSILASSTMPGPMDRWGSVDIFGMLPVALSSRLRPVGESEGPLGGKLQGVPFKLEVLESGEGCPS